MKKYENEFLYIYDKNHINILKFKNFKRFYKIFENKNNIFFSSIKHSKNIITFGLCHKNLDGTFVRIEFDKRSIKFFTDSISAIPVYYKVTTNNIIVSSSIGLMIDICKSLNISVRINEDAINEILLSSYIFTRSLTPLDKVLKITPNSILKVCLKNGKNQIKYNKIDFNYSSTERSFDDCVLDLRTNILKGLMRHKGKKVGVLLSGGADSRLIAACAVEAGLKPEFITFGQSTVNSSDFSIANYVAYKLGAKTECYFASSDNFKSNWKETNEKLNWSGDQVWYFGKLPKSFFKKISTYDVILRGDGDGVYGWGDNVGNIYDVFHKLEICHIESFKKYATYFKNEKKLFYKINQRIELLMNNYKIEKNINNLKNKLYVQLREEGCIAPSLGYLSSFVKVDSPLMWSSSIKIASYLPKNKRSNKEIIFSVLKTFKTIRDIDFSQGSSWNNNLEFYFSNIWEYLIEYSLIWSPWKLDQKGIKQFFNKPPSPPKNQTILQILKVKIKYHLQKNITLRNFVFKKYPQLFESTFKDRGLIRVAVISNLNERINSSRGFFCDKS